MATLTLQPAETDLANRDTMIGSTFAYQTTNFGTWPLLTIGTQNLIKGLQGIFRAILRFDLTSIVGATITDATLALTTSGGIVTNETVTIHRLTQPNWTELGATWLTYNGSNGWAVQGGDFVSTPVQTLVLTSLQHLVFNNIKSLVEDAIELRGGMLDVLIKGAATSGHQIVDSFSSSDANPLNRPKLVVNYEYPRWCVETADKAVWSVATQDKGC